MKMNIENLSSEIKRDVFRLITNGIHRENNYNRFLFSYGCSKEDYTFTSPMSLEGYYNKKTIKFFRDEDIKRKNETVKKMCRVFDQYPEKIYVREVVILIDMPRWKEICTREGLTEEYINNTKKEHGEKVAGGYKSFMNKKHLRLDWLFPDYHVNIEHDGESYHVPLEDRIRDIYLKEVFPELKIIRIKNYTERREYELRRILEGMKEPKQKPLVLRYENYVWECYLREHANALFWIDHWHNRFDNIPYGQIYDKIRGKYPEDQEDIRRVEWELKSLNSL